MPFAVFWAHLASATKLGRLPLPPSPTLFLEKRRFVPQRERDERGATTGGALLGGDDPSALTRQAYLNPTAILTLAFFAVPCTQRFQPGSLERRDTLNPHKTTQAPFLNVDGRRFVRSWSRVALKSGAARGQTLENYYTLPHLYSS